MTVKYKLYGVSKAYKVISKKYLIQLTVPFYRIYLNLIPKIVIYNSNKYIVHFLNNIMQINKVKIIVKKLFLI